ncbi:ISAs1 family transposase [Pectobacterium brasiliense]|uniref:ISAs1 family transposase n=1 Tax=Pectobacterium brasiliense TaxID=180957 RepID=UPI0019691915|nr:ISAs1 family transposase [Pectobacterium brasiliense]QSD45974.1 ISAs1 family transposase [Pectobacterium brasiliense]
MTLFDHLSLVEETRSPINQQHHLVDVLFLVLAAVASGQNGWAEIQQFGELRLDWLRKFRLFSNDIPRRHTIARIMKAVDPDSFQFCIFSWINDIRAKSSKPLIAIDGKTLKSASLWSRNDFHSVNAYDLNNGIALYQDMAEGKGKEIKTVQNLVCMLNIKDALITLDALHAQKETLESIVARKGHYLVQVKGNQPTLFNAVKAQFHEAFNDDTALAQYEMQDKGHGRMERRITFQIPAELSPELQEKWPSIKTLVAVERHRKDKKSNTLDTAYYLSSYDIDAEFMATSVRHHWGIENSLHWVLDVVYKEDACRIHDENCTKVLSLVRKMALNLAKMESTQNRSMKSKVQRALLDDDYRELMIFANVKCH